VIMRREKRALQEGALFKTQSNLKKPPLAGYPVTFRIRKELSEDGKKKLLVKSVFRLILFRPGSCSLFWLRDGGRWGWQIPIGQIGESFCSLGNLL